MAYPWCEFFWLFRPLMANGGKRPDLTVPDVPMHAGPKPHSCRSRWPAMLQNWR